MKRNIFLISLALALTLALIGIACAPAPPPGKKPIVIGVPASLGTEHGPALSQPVILAAEEINEAGGVKVGEEMRPFKVEVMDSRDLEPGVPVSEALNN